MKTPKARAFMNEYLSKKGKFQNYFDARWARQKNNHHVILEVCEELKKRGCECYVSKDDFNREKVEIAYVFNGNYTTVFGFSDVPFRWYINSEYLHGRFDGGENNGYDFPYEIEDILNDMQPSTDFDKWKKDPISHVKL